ncbi:MAG: hypothetical protein BGO67_07765 [Alphaproteobacteria bacterium 41-28]|nr:MAG: hypothetical protein BGO67_07765 [Alphaproteobacteria bacterium 41-28]
MKGELAAQAANNNLMGNERYIFHFHILIYEEDFGRCQLFCGAIGFVKEIIIVLLFFIEILVIV